MNDDDHALEEILRTVAAASLPKVPSDEGHPSILRFRDAILHEDWTDDERNHLASCPRCRRQLPMFERATWHPKLSQLVRRRLNMLSPEEQADLDRHLEKDACRHCQRLEKVLEFDRFFVRLLERARGAVGAAAEALFAGLDRIATSRGLVPVPAAGGGFHGFDDGQSQTSTTIDFDDEGFVASLKANDDKSLRLSVECPGATPGSLIHVLLTDGAYRWESFAVLQEYFVAPIALMNIASPPSAGCLALARHVVAAGLEAGEVPALVESFHHACTDDPRSMPLWKAWAQTALGEPHSDQAVRPALVEIAESEPTGI